MKSPAAFAAKNKYLKPKHVFLTLTECLNITTQKHRAAIRENIKLNLKKCKVELICAFFLQIYSACS